jgi:hypothetical protein
MYGGKSIWEKKVVAWLKYLSGGAEKDNENSASMTGLPAEILTGNFPNKKQVHQPLS